jgi:hypothetical protein
MMAGGTSSRHRGFGDFWEVGAMAKNALKAFIDTVISLILAGVKQDKAWEVHITGETRGEKRFRVMTINSGHRKQFTIPPEECEED